MNVIAKINKWISLPSDQEKKNEEKRLKIPLLHLFIIFDCKKEVHYDWYWLLFWWYIFAIDDGNGSVLTSRKWEK